MAERAPRRFVRPFAELSMDDVATVGAPQRVQRAARAPRSADVARCADVAGGKNASLGEMVRELSAKGVQVRRLRCCDATRHQHPVMSPLNWRTVTAQVPDGFATTAEAFRVFLAENKLDGRIRDALASLDVADTKALRRTGEAIRGWVNDATLPAQLADEIVSAYRDLCAADAAAARAAGHGDAAPSNSHMMAVAVRSSATAEDLPDASFAGQQDTYLNVEGASPRLRSCAAAAQ
jgi:pyruvate,water dikinase